MTDDPLASAPLLRALFGAEGHLWSAGTLAAFMALPAEGSIAASGPDLILTTGDCLARLRPGMQGARLLAFETLSSDPRGWNHGIALCLPAPQQPLHPGPLRITQDDPILPGDAGPVLDLGLGQGASRALFRPALPGTLSAEGLAWAEAAPLLARTPGTWIIDTPVLRIERTVAEGIAFHSVEQALATGRSHAATTPVPEGLIPVAHIFPPHPARLHPGAPMEFDPDRHTRFQAILARHGRPGLHDLKTEVRAQLASGRFAPPPADRHGTTVIRVALRQHLHLHGQPPRPWLDRFDRPLLQALEG